MKAPTKAQRRREAICREFAEKYKEPGDRYFSAIGVHTRDDFNAIPLPHLEALISLLNSVAEAAR